MFSLKIELQNKQKFMVKLTKKKILNNQPRCEGKIFYQL